MRLKLCPFCGHKPDLIKEKEEGVIFIVQCWNCGTFKLAKEEKEAISLWNTRSS